jgi:UDP-glucose 4-epimerase
MKKLKVLVTGGAGFIGSHLTRRLVEEGCAVTILDNLQSGRIENLVACLGSIRLLQADIRDRDAVMQSMRGIRVVFHLAAQSRVMRASANVGETLSINVAGTATIVEAAHAAGVRRLVFTSSREVYGEPAKLPVDESAALNPKNPYGMSKVAGEMCCSMAAGDGLETSIVRIANAYGPGDRDRVIPRFVESARVGSPLVVYGGTQLLDFVPVGYVVDVLLRLGLGEYFSGPINIASGEGVTILELAKHILKISNSTSDLKVLRGRDIEVNRFVASTVRAARLGFQYERPALTELAQLIDAGRRSGIISAAS